MKCKDCACYKNEWCSMVTDSPDTDMERDCGHFIRAQRWIPVTERLPETGEVLATNGDVIAVAPASSVRRKDTYITHWMPLPELPGGGDPDDPA